LSDYQLPNNCRYTIEDEWLRGDDSEATIGISDYAQQQLGDVVFVELPAVGGTLVKGQPFGVIESVKAVSDLIAPISGEVMQINEALEEKPELVNEDCYGEGWMLVVAPSDPSEGEDLLDAGAYRQNIASRED
jgi:glycine cleavage system H protein